VAALVALPVGAAAAPRENTFACPGESEALVRGLSTDRIAAEIERRLAAPPAADDPAPERARHHCVTAELMRRVGDPRAGAYYEKAIAAAPDEPGYELWYGYYLRNVRGPRHPLDQPAEQHYFGALEKIQRLQRAHAAEEFDRITASWARRGLLDLYQEDGFPLLPGKAYPYEGQAAGAWGLSFTTIARLSRDTGGFGEIDDARRLTSEAAFSSSSQRLGRPLDRAELEGLLRAPPRYELYNRMRLRVPWLGSLDAGYDVFRAPRSQITYFTEPNNFGDVRVDQASVGFSRAVDLYPLFDLFVDVGYRRIVRTGVVEWFPQQRETVHMFEAHPRVARFLGPDKLTVGMNYVLMDIPEAPGGPLYDRARARAIRAFWADYAIYRPLLLPDRAAGELRRTATRGWHFYGGYALDDEAYGVRAVQRRDAYAGTTLRGVGGFDVTLQGTLFTADTRYTARTAAGAIEPLTDAPQTNAQARPAVVLLYRLVDDEAIPDVPRTPLAGLNLVVPVRHDFPVKGSNAFENTRAGVELWAKLISTGLRGTTFLCTAGYEVQWFERLGTLVHLGRIELRMGWSRL
jgi:hypothetical protein